MAKNKPSNHHIDKKSSSSSKSDPNVDHHHKKKIKSDKVSPFDVLTYGTGVSALFTVVLFFTTVSWPTVIVIAGAIETLFLGLAIAQWGWKIIPNKPH